MNILLNSLSILDELKLGGHTRQTEKLVRFFQSMVT